MMRRDQRLTGAVFDVLIDPVGVPTDNRSMRFRGAPGGLRTQPLAAPGSAQAAGW
jgi:hypothetical protein